MQKSLDAKLARIAADPSCGDFILADAKDADMAFGISARSAPPKRDNAVGETPLGYRSSQEFRDQIREIVAQQLVDIMLMSASTSDVLAVQRAAFRQQPRHAGNSRERHDRHLAGRRQGRATADNPRCHFARRFLKKPMERSRQSVPSAAGRPGPVLHHAQQRRDVWIAPRCKRTAISARKRDEVGFRHFLEVFAPNAPD